MTDQDRYIPGVPCWVDTTQPDPDKAAAFYGGLFGWELENGMPPDAPRKYLMARLPGGTVGAISSPMGDAPPAATWNTYVWVEDADATAAKVRDAGGTVLSEPFDVMEAGRMGVFADPEGAVFCIWQPKEHRGATLVNEHGSVNFNVLNTGDLEGAKAFYGAVFGWEAIGVGDASWWARPAYGDFLEARTPGLRENMAAMGAPARFEQVVAGIGHAPDGQARWDVTFGADDADAIAAR